jgi:uncharacterized membrane protein YfcA
LEGLIGYLLLGAFAGTIAGLFGVGGGLIIVPILAIMFKHQEFSNDIIMHLAIGTSLATIILTSISSVIAHHRRGAVLWPVFMQLAPGILAGAFGGAYIADLISSDILKIGVGVFAVIAAVKMILDFKPQPQRELPGKAGMTLVGGGIGVISALIGIGGGTLTTPFLLWCNKTIRNAIATSAACGLPIAVAGAAGYIRTGLDSQILPEWSSGYVYWPALFGITLASVIFAPLGAWLAHKLPMDLLKKCFALLLAVIGIRLLFL